jgi:hypothetical protein
MAANSCLSLIFMDIPLAKDRSFSDQNIQFLMMNIRNAECFLKCTQIELMCFVITHASSKYPNANKPHQEDSSIAVTFELTLMKLLCIVIMISLKEKICHLQKINFKN